MNASYDLTRLDPATFEHLVNSIVLSVLGAGATGFGPGSDGGRDTYFEGEASYPSTVNRWNGVWYIQSKFHAPHLSTDPQKWLLNQITSEITAFQQHTSKRTWPDNWIIATNIEPSGHPMTGAFDKARALVEKARPNLKHRFHIWGGTKILDFLHRCPHISRRYLHFLTPGHILSALISQLADTTADLGSILQHLIVRKFKEQKLTKLEQAGSQSDAKPMIHNLFVDLPFICTEHSFTGDLLQSMVSAAGECHRTSQQLKLADEWQKWSRHPKRARVWFLKGGPGQGKSTIGQYFCQIQRAALLLEDKHSDVPALKATFLEYALADEVKLAAEEAGFWPLSPRIPIHIELKDYAQWYGSRLDPVSPKGILTAVAASLSASLEHQVNVATLKRALRDRSWVIVFDGLDEVPQDVKDHVAAEVTHFIDDIATEQDCDLLAICSSRPQGYSGQFGQLDCITAELQSLSTGRAIECARKLVSYQRSASEAEQSLLLLSDAAASSSVRELLTTPLQAHIVAVVVRDGERPPERRWKLYHRFYDVIRRREANRNLPEASVARILREDERLLKVLHNRVGLRLHADAETSDGAQTSLDRSAFREIALRTVSEMIESNISDKVAALDVATTERLVLISTPDDRSRLRFDIRQLQEFFAAECIYDSVCAEDLRSRVAIIANDSHWREVIHFLLSALIENNRHTELDIALQALCALNDGDSNGPDRTYARRSAKGGLIAARLLAEGVLEQDRHTRQRFRDCLAPLGGIAAHSRLRALLNVTHANSRTWLITFLLDLIRETKYSENVGAAVVLLQITPADHSRLSELIEAVSGAPASYLTIMADSLISAQSRASRLSCPAWFARILFERLEGPSWFELGSATVRAFALVLYSLYRATSIPTNLSDFANCFPLVELFATRWTSRRHTIGIRFGSIEIRIPDASSFATNTAMVNPPVPAGGRVAGFFELLRVTALFLRQPSASGYSAILDEVSDERASEILFAAFDFPLLNSDCLRRRNGKEDAFFGLNRKQFNAWWLDQRGDVYSCSDRMPEFLIDREESVSARDIVALHTFSPPIALELISDLSSTTDGVLIAADAIDSAYGTILGRIVENPEQLQRIPWTWYALASRSGDDRGTFLESLCKSCRAGLPYRRLHDINGMQESFRSGLSKSAGMFKLFEETGESALLPFVADWYVSQVVRVRAGSRIDASVTGHGSGAANVVFEGSSEALHAVVSDHSNCWSVRCAAAIILTTIVESPREPLYDVRGLIVSNAKSEGFEWLVDCVSSTLSTWRQSETPALQDFVRDLLEAVHDQFELRAMLEGVLSVWRESSAAPVTSRHLRDKWMFRDTK